MKKLKYISIITLIFSLATGCSRYDAEDISMTVTANKSNVKVGETVEFTINHDNTEKLVVYQGDQGHDYQKSSDYLLAGLTHEQLCDSIYRTPDPLIRKYTLNFADLTEIPSDVEYPEMELVDDDVTQGKKALKVTLYPNDWGKVLKFYPRVGVGSNNQDFTIKLRFDSNDIYKLEGGQWVTGSTKANFRVVTEVIGKTADGEVVYKFDQAKPNSLWYGNVITPSSTYFNQTINISKWMANWEASTGLKLQTIECITMKFVGDNNAAYKGNIYISSVELGVDGYYDFDKGTNIAILNNSGKNTYSCSFDKPGTYNVTFVAINNSFKNYSGDGYQTDRNDISGNNYKYGKRIVTIPIVVE